MWACLGNEDCRVFSWNDESAFVYQSDYSLSTLDFDYLKHDSCFQPSKRHKDATAYFKRDDNFGGAFWDGTELSIKHIVAEATSIAGGEVVFELNTDNTGEIPFDGCAAGIWTCDEAGIPTACIGSFEICTREEFYLF